MIMQLVNYFIGTFLISISTYYVAVKIANRKLELTKLHTLKWLIIETIFLSMLYLLKINDILRIIVNMLMLVYVYYKLLKVSIFHCLILSFMSFGFILISEILFITFNVLIFDNTTNFMKENYSVTLTSNIIIASLAILISNIKILINTYKNLFKEIKIRCQLDISVVIISSIVCLIILLYYIFFDINPIANIIIALFLILCYLSFPVIILEQKNANYKLRIQYETILKDIENYENDLTEQRIKNHENMNILISIKGMISKNNKQLHNFVNQLISDNMEDDKNILYMTRNIPIGGLQGLIYQKLLVMKNKNINFFINVDKEITNNSFNNLPVNLVKDICMIIGVFIDNAIQEIDKKDERNFFLNIYGEKSRVIIEVANNYQGNLEVNLFDKKVLVQKESVMVMV